MKILLWTFAIVLIMTFVVVYQDDYNQLYRENINLKFYSQEAAAAAAQYFVVEEYSEGRMVFNREEAVRAAEYVLQQNLKLNEDFVPLHNSYWKEAVHYDIEFFDEGNTFFPYLYEHPSEYFILLMTAPTVVVTVDAGRPAFRLFEDIPRMLRVGAHTWQQR